MTFGLKTRNVAEADRLFEALAEGGNVEVRMQRVPWAEKDGI